jgi:hypothetical protein
MSPYAQDVQDKQAAHKYISKCTWLPLCCCTSRRNWRRLAASARAEAMEPSTLMERIKIDSGSTPSTYPAPIRSARSSTLPSVPAISPSQLCRSASCWCCRYRRRRGGRLPSYQWKANRWLPQLARRFFTTPGGISESCCSVAALGLSLQSCVV